MQVRLILRALGILLCGEAVLMIPSLIVAFIYGDGDATAFLISMAILLAAGLPPAAFIRFEKRQLFTRDGFALVGLGWLLLSVFGALPYMFSGVAPNFIDALFESASGFTTTGASILRYVEGQPHGILFWRSFSHWVGGMGVLVLTIAVFPKLGSRNMEILRAESTGPAPGKLMPRLRNTAKMLYTIYLGMSAIMVFALLIAGMPLFDSLTTMFGTAGTGGFSVRNASIGSYQSLPIELITGVFMLLFGVNFGVFYALIVRDFRKAFHNQELWLYGGLVLASVGIIALNILPMYENFWVSLRHSFFQVASIITTTGFGTVDYNIWPPLSHVVILLLMVIGSCAGSTGGGIKVSRLLLLGKAFGKELNQILHPRIVRAVLVDGKPVEDSTVRSVLVFFFAYMAICVAGMMVVALDGYDLISTMSAVLSAMGNIGPGLARVGPAGNFADLSMLSKSVLTLCMLMGRLEIMPILLLFSPSLWRRS